MTELLRCSGCFERPTLIEWIDVAECRRCMRRCGAEAWDETYGTHWRCVPGVGGFRPGGQWGGVGV